MNLKDFVAESLKEIVDGVTAAQVYAREKTKSRINSDRHSSFIIPPQLIEFDVAVTVKEGTSTAGGLGIVVGPVALGSKGKSDASNESVSRIKFGVPVSFEVDGSGAK